MSDTVIFHKLGQCNGLVQALELSAVSKLLTQSSAYDDMSRGRSEDRQLQISATPTDRH